MRFVFLAIILTFVLIKKGYCQTPQFKDIPVSSEGKKKEDILQFVEVVNSNDPAIMKNFFSSYVGRSFFKVHSINSHLQTMLGLYRMSGGLEIICIRQYPDIDTMTFFICKGKAFENWFSVGIAEEEDSISAISLSAALPPENAIEYFSIDEKNLIKELKNKFKELKRNDLFSGTVLVANEEEILFEGAAGEASKSFHIKNNIHTKFNIGSLNKMFTSVAIMQLLENKLLKLSDPIVNYIDTSWFPLNTIRNINVLHLLTHTSGLGNYFNYKFLNSSKELFRELSDYKELIRGDTVSFNPGSNYYYSNIGMLLLGVIIEKVSGLNYYDYIRRNIYLPAAMKNSDSYDLDRPQENLAEGYILQPDGTWKNNLFIHVIRGGPAGGGYSTVHDLYRFSVVLQKNHLISELYKNRMFTDYNQIGYGFGFTVKQMPKEKIVGHEGAFPGINCKLSIYLKSHYTVIILSNYDGGAIGISNYIEGLISRVKD